MIYRKYAHEKLVGARELEVKELQTSTQCNTPGSTQSTTPGSIQCNTLVVYHLKIKINFIFELFCK